MALPSSVFPSGPSVSSASPFEPRRREFAIPTPDGGEQTIREPVKMVSSGAKTRQLRDLSSAEKSARRGLKNTIVFAVCGAILAGLMWWLLQ